jgi:hypothetical protein
MPLASNALPDFQRFTIGHEEASVDYVNGDAPPLMPVCTELLRTSFSLPKAAE